MPVLLNSDRPPAGCIRVGLINNMGDEALKTTERQYVSLLNQASDGLPVSLSFYSLPEIPRSASIARHVAAHYAGIDDLWDGRLDGLIITGREPLAKSLREEPYWESFTRTLEWAQDNVHSTVCSCLAAHAAVLLMDGIDRVKRSEKLFGIFECERVADHPLTAAMPSKFKLPHSRWNGLPEEALLASGYSVLARTADGEVDTFVRQSTKLFVFFQGHPEYDSDTLLREYRRDLKRYCKGELCAYPSTPRDYFDPTTTVVLDALQQQSKTGQGEHVLPALPDALEDIVVENTWQSSATALYRNWLSYIRTQSNIAERSKGAKANMCPVPVCSTDLASQVSEHSPI